MTDERRRIAIVITALVPKYTPQHELDLMASAAYVQVEDAEHVDALKPAYALMLASDFDSDPDTSYVYAVIRDADSAGECAEAFVPNDDEPEPATKEHGHRMDLDHHEDGTVTATCRDCSWTNGPGRTREVLIACSGHDADTRTDA